MSLLLLFCCENKNEVNSVVGVDLIYIGKSVVLLYKQCYNLF